MFATSSDGTRVAYDVIGRGAPLVLLHGGFVQDRRSWAEAGYVARLRDSFRLLVVDLRGHGESDYPQDEAAYAAARVCGDILAVLDAQRVPRAAVWGYSFGAGVALQLVLAAQARVERLALGGAALGRWLSPEAAERTIAGIATLAAAKARGELEAAPIPEVHKDFARRADLSVAQAAFRAMASWPTVEVAALSCPALLYAGSKNVAGMDIIEKYGDALLAAGARCEVIGGLDHVGEFTSIDRTLPLVLGFLQAERSQIEKEARRSGA